MAALSEYPITGDAVVRGDPLTIPVTIDVEGSIATWTWRAQVRSVPDGDLVTTFAITTDPDDAHTLLLSLTAAQTALLAEGMGFDLEQLTPVVRTWWICTALRVVKDYSHA